MLPILDGVNVVELCEGMAGQFAGRLLSDYGAEVMAVEPPQGRTIRAHGPFREDLPHRETGGLHLYLNHNKLGVTLDIDRPVGREMLGRLLGNADLLLCDLPLDRVDSVGLDPAGLRNRQPRLVAVYLTPFGLDGPYRDFRAYHLNVYHAAGPGFVTPSGIPYEKNPDREPLMGGGNSGEFQVGFGAATAALAGLLERDIDGMGQTVDVSQLEVLANLSRRDLSAYPAKGEEYSRSTLYTTYVGGLHRCRDGHVIVVVMEDHEWNGLVDLMGRPDWAVDPGLAAYVNRTKRRNEVNSRLAKWTAEQSVETIVPKGVARGVPIAPVRTPRQVLASGRAADNGLFREVEHPLAGSVVIPAEPTRFVDVQNGAERPAPLLGEHNTLVYRDRLAMAAEDLRLLRQTGAI